MSNASSFRENGDWYVLDNDQCSPLSKVFPGVKYPDDFTRNRECKSRYGCLMLSDRQRDVCEIFFDTRVGTLKIFAVYYGGDGELTVSKFLSRVRKSGLMRMDNRFNAWLQLRG